MNYKEGNYIRFTSSYDPLYKKGEVFKIMKYTLGPTYSSSGLYINNTNDPLKEGHWVDGLTGYIEVCFKRRLIEHGVKGL
jgi:hypothetical protein